MYCYGKKDIMPYKCITQRCHTLQMHYRKMSCFINVAKKQFLMSEKDIMPYECFTKMQFLINAVKKKKMSVFVNTKTSLMLLI